MELILDKLPEVHDTIKCKMCGGKMRKIQPTPYIIFWVHSKRQKCRRIAYRTRVPAWMKQFNFRAREDNMASQIPDVEVKPDGDK